jgi:hypothetical protein
MRCSEVKNNLVDYATGKLNSVEIAEHLEKCEDCGLEFERIKNVVSILSEYKIEEPSEFYWSNFLYRVKRKIAQRNNISTFALKPILFAPSMAVIIIGFLLGIGFSNLFVSQPDFYLSQVSDFEITGVLVKPSELSEVSTETLEMAVSYLYEKYQMPDIDAKIENYQEIDIEEVLKRIENKF